LALLAGLNGDWQNFHPTAVSMRAWMALLYLGVFGSLVALSAYVWLLRVSTPARVSTYAYVNPVVAVILGWALLDEQLGSRTIVAALIIVTAVVVITTQRARVTAVGNPTCSPSTARAELAPTPIKR
jgi:drug/metabolite transporter (DMT)-like permease